MDAPSVVWYRAIWTAINNNNVAPVKILLTELKKELYSKEFIQWEKAFAERKNASVGWNALKDLVKKRYNPKRILKKALEVYQTKTSSKAAKLDPDEFLGKGSYT